MEEDSVLNLGRYPDALEQVSKVFAVKFPTFPTRMVI